MKFEAIMDIKLKGMNIEEGSIFIPYEMYEVDCGKLAIGGIFPYSNREYGLSINVFNTAFREVKEK